MEDIVEDRMRFDIVAIRWRGIRLRYPDPAYEALYSRVEALLHTNSKDVNVISNNWTSERGEIEDDLEN